MLHTRRIFRVVATSATALIATHGFYASCEQPVPLSTSGFTWTWGSNQYGQLGLGDLKDSLKPTSVPQLGPVYQVACGSQHCAVINGTRQCNGLLFFIFYLF